jgi:outer membrane protein TolC
MDMTFAAVVKRCIILLLAFCGAVMTASCHVGSLSSLRPNLGIPALANPFRNPDHVRFTQANAAAALAHHRITPAEAIVGKKKLDLEECRAMALRNNLDLQVARLDEILKKSIEASNRTKVLPHMVYSGELSERDNTLYSYSDPMGFEGQAPQAGGGTGVNNWATSHERGTWRYTCEARWSPTDAALAFYVTRSSMNDSLKSHYQRVRVAQKLMGVVDAAYFRLLSLEQCLPIAEELAAICARVAKNTERLLENRLRPIEDYHKAKQRLIKARAILDGIRNEAERERNNLASAMGLSPGLGKDCGITVVGALDAPVFRADICQLEMEAVMNRPEAYQAGLNQLNSVNDLRRAIVKYFPKLTGFWRFTHDKDKYIWNKDWKDVGMYIYFDFLDWIVNRDEAKAADAMVAKTNRELGAVALGITSQVRLAALKYIEAIDKLRAAEESLASSNKVLTISQQRLARDAAGELAVDEAKANILQEKVERLRALGEANANLAELHTALGTNYKEPVAHP